MEKVYSDMTSTNIHNIIGPVKAFDRYGIELHIGDTIRLDDIEHTLVIDEIKMVDSYISKQDELSGYDVITILYNKKLNISFLPEDCEKWLDDPLKFREYMPI